MARHNRVWWRYLLVGISSLVETASAKNLRAAECRWNPAGPLAPTSTDTACPSVIDDETAGTTGNWEPWAYPPVCVEATRPPYSKLCSYTHDGFRGKTGIGVVTTPEHAANLIRILEDRDPRWLPPAQGEPAAWPPPYVIEPVAGKGLGVKANRTIHEGEIIIVDQPLILRIIDHEQWSDDDVGTLLAETANDLSSDDRHTVTSMARSTGGDYFSDILNTNAFSIYLGDEPHSGLFPEIAVRTGMVGSKMQEHKLIKHC